MSDDSNSVSVGGRVISAVEVAKESTEEDDLQYFVEVDDEGEYYIANIRLD